MEKDLEDHGYQLIRKIGSGGYANVYLVYSKHFEMEFAAKVLPLKDQPEEKVQLYLKEAQVNSELPHPNILNLYDYFVTDSLYLILEYCPNGNLMEHIQKHGPFQDRQLASFMNQLISAIGFLHSNGFAHLDIKPSNVLIDRYGRFKLSDFGTVQKFSKLEMCHVFKCSPCFASPEVHLRQPHNPFLRDIWSFGITIYYASTGELPFIGDTKESVRRSIVSGIYEIPELPFKLRKIITRCLNMKPEERMPTEEAITEVSNYHKEYASMVSSAPRFPVFQKLETNESKLPYLKARKQPQLKCNSLAYKSYRASQIFERKMTFPKQLGSPN